MKDSTSKSQVADPKFRLIFEQAGIGIALTRSDGKFERANPEFCRMLGYTEAELKKISFQSIAHRDDFRRYLEATGRLLRKEVNAFSCEMRLMHKSGRVVWVQKSDSILRDAPRKPGFLLSVVHEVTGKENSVTHAADASLFTFLDVLPVGVFVVDAERRPFYANPAAREILGSGIEPGARDDESNEVYAAYVAGTGREYPTSRMPIVRAFAGETTVIEDMEIERHTGRIRVQVSAAPVRSPAGDIVYAVAVLANISEQRPAEELRRTQAFAQALLRSRDDALFAFDHEMRVTLWTPGIEKLCGITAELALGRSILDVMPHIRASGEKELISAALAGEEGNATRRELDQNGEITVYDARYVPILSAEAGQVLGGLAFFQDVGKLQAVQDLATRYRDRYHAICESVTDLVAVTSLSGEFLFSSSSYTRLLGYASAELIGSSIFDIVHPEDRGDLRATQRRYLAGSDEQLRARYRIMRKDGEFLWFDTSLRPLAGTYGRDRELMCVSHDITREVVRTGGSEDRHTDETRMKEWLASHDELTGLYNRATAENMLSAKLSSMRASTFPVGCLIIDVDGFKAIGETGGAATADAVLKKVAAILTDTCRGDDFISRYGADEFFITLPATDVTGTLIVGEKVLRNLRAAKWSDTGYTENVTVSIGATCFVRDSGLTLRELIDLIDAQLQQAKEAGRNCMIMNNREPSRPTPRAFFRNGSPALHGDLSNPAEQLRG